MAAVAKPQLNAVQPPFNGVQVFSATKAQDREHLGTKVTEWIRSHDYTIVDTIVTQSSDSEFHCLVITVFYNDPKIRTK